MGRYSDSEDEYKRSKKKKRKVSRSRSRSSESSYSSSKKHKRSKKKKSKKVRSRSVSPDRRYNKRSRSRTPASRRQSRSPRRQGRSRSWSPRRSRSRSRARYRSRSRSPRYRARRSRSWSRSPRPRRSRSPRNRRSRSRSRSYSRRSRSRSVERLKMKKEKLADDKDPSKNIPGWDIMTPSEQAEARLQMALKAAASVDENLREQGVLPFSSRKLGNESGSNSPMLYDEQFNRNKAISEIESSGFAQMSFKSSKSQKNISSDLNDIHDAVIFGGDIKLGAGGEMPILSASNQPLKSKDTESLMHPNLYVSAEEKMDRWIQKLKAFRRSKIEGEVMK